MEIGIEYGRDKVERESREAEMRAKQAEVRERDNSEYLKSDLESRKY